MLNAELLRRFAAAGMLCESNEFGDEHDEDREKSIETKNVPDDCFESPLQSLEAHFLSQQRSYPSRFLEQGLLGLCCDIDIEEPIEPMSKTIKAATMELSSPRINVNKPVFDKTVFGDLEVNAIGQEPENAAGDNQQPLSAAGFYCNPIWSMVNSNGNSLEATMSSQSLVESVKCHSEDCAKLDYKAPLKLPAYTSNGIVDANTGHASPTSPTERHQFFKWFSNIVRLSQSSQEKKLHNVICLEDNVTLRTMRYFIWMELLAWHKGCSPDDMESILNLRRQTISSVVESVLNFTVTFQGKIQSTNIPTEAVFQIKQENETNDWSSNIVISDVTSQVDVGYESDHGSLPGFIDNNGSGLPSLRNIDTTCECSETLSVLCQNCVDQETFALQQVEVLIESVDRVENLYPSLRSLSEHIPAYKNKRFLCRLKTLYAWFNLIKELRHKVDLLAKLFGIKDRRKAGWPCYRAEPVEVTGNESPEVALYGNDTKNLPRTIQFRNFAVDFSSPSTSGSDKSEKAKGSIPSSPDFISEPFNMPQVPPCPPDGSNHSSKSIYRKYIDHTLRHHGLKRMQKHLFTPLRPVLYRVHSALKKPKPEFSPDVPAKFVSEQLSPTKTFESALPVKKEYLDELASVGVWSECFQSMGLPTFHKPFFFLLRVFLDVMHECLCLRLEQQPEKPSLLSVGQLIKECKEVLRAATQTRQKYMNLAQTVLGESGNEIIEAQLDTFDDDMKKMLKVYLEYLHHRILIMPNVPQTTRHQKSYLEEEWCFVRAICPNIPGGEALAAKKFCFMSSSLLHSIGAVLTDGIREELKKFHEIGEEKSKDQLLSRKSQALQTYREIKHIFQDLSERARQVITLSKSLRKDLEIAAEFSLVVPTITFLTKLKETGHIRVIAPHTSGHVMFVPGNLQHHEMLIWQLVDMTCGHEALDIDGDQAIYLVMIECSKIELRGLIWDGPTIILEPTAEASITLSHVEVNGVLLVVNHSSQLISQCKKFQNFMGDTLKVNKQQTSCNYAIAEALSDLKCEALELWDLLASAVKQIEEELDVFPVSVVDDSDQASLLSSYREVLHQGFRFAFEYQKDVMRLITGEAKDRFYSKLSKFAVQWMKFVMEKCDEGRGLQTRWASQGLEFLITVFNSPYGHNLPVEEFESLQQMMYSCIMHLGCTEKSMASRSLNSPTAGFFQRFPYLRRTRTSLSVSSSDSVLSASSCSNEDNVRRKRSRDETAGENEHKCQPDHEVSISPMERVRRKLETLEKDQQKLLTEKGVIGRISTVKIERMPLHVSARRVTFPWQRCFKIGEGRFGKVYTAVNNSTGELIAMKEINLQPNDHRAIKEALDEIRTFEGIKHPNLVRYYGVEVHREEMLIFMEYCNEGSLESAAQLHLPESLIRKYTRQLLEAVNVLHEHNIVHRDIKSANIFLTSNGELKLGDFGCCIKLKNNTTMPGELCGFVGTPAYMAPEVFTKNVEGGHGRAADVWSIGCVVLEMITAKRPWHELENSYQIMFTVGMGGVPEIPDHVNEEARDFLDKCLLTNPKERWSAGQLLSHPFTKVPEEEFS